MELTEEKREEVLQESIPPMGFRMIAREFVKEKMAMFSLILLVIILLAVFIGSLVLDQSAVMHVSILGTRYRYNEWHQVHFRCR